MSTSYTTLVAAKTVAGSIKRSVNYAEIDVETVLEEAQTLIYGSLRVREMRSMWSPAMAVGDSSKALPSDFLDPAGKLRDTRTFCYRQRSSDHLMSARVYTSAGALESGQPTFWAIFDEAINFDIKFDANSAGTLSLPYFKRPALLASGTNETNFLTTRYPHLLRQACRIQCHAFMKNWTGYSAELPLLTSFIQSANGEADLTYGGDADYDQDTPHG